MSANSVLSKEAFFAACANQRMRPSTIPNFGTVNVLKMTLAQIKDFEKEADNFDRAVLMVQHAIADASGNAIFASKDEVAALPITIFNDLSKAVSEVNSLKNPEDAAKNSGPATTADLN